MRWVVFAIVSLGWVGICWFFGGMVAVSDAIPKSTIAQQECAQRMVREGRATDFFAARDSAECRAVQRQVAAEGSRPHERRALLIGLLPVVVVGGLLTWAGRR